MIYIIDDQITYNSDDCTLSHIPTHETLSLSISSGRLFEQLLNSQGEILARDTLLTEVWDKYGLRGSNSNLNQYLSILRRALASYGCENLIITIPKIGIRLNTEIKIEREFPPAFVAAEVQTNELPAENVVPGQYSQVITPGPVMVDKLAKKSLLTFRQATLAIIMLMLLGSAFWYYTAQKPGENNQSMNTLKLEGGCEAVIIQGLDVFEKKLLNKQILEILKENNQSCVPGRRLYFDKNTSFSTTDYGRTILSACNLNSSGHIVSCDNIYYLDWRTF
ncbi:winged helix-turn-helix domain-containing protein [Pantoea agglomerans]|uniref:winged helix-turn-helix domain-containing protein n=1 Tax=Enterobacter agglomerans TaxID=549 RepID=UPI0013CC0A1C|nr:winged helix-turn-helix domain-containing protein [Pantoea agglomerans]NEG60622.1 transcriptional regulator [Pantoea agglomerans]NEH05273.1 transcriptional regulator [Pantoea agglomerans]